MTKETEDGRYEWQPFGFGKMLDRIHREEVREWLKPKSGDLLRDVAYLQSRIGHEKSRTVRGIYSRSTIVMAVATIEAVTNDALATIFELLTDAIPSECVGEPPWCYFVGRSDRRISSLLRRGSFRKKRAYVLGQIERIKGRLLDEELTRDIDQLVLFRNRIVHMSYYERPNRYQPLLNTGQVEIAELAIRCAREYLDFLSDEYSELNLPIPTIRPFRDLQNDLRQAQ